MVRLEHLDFKEPLEPQDLPVALVQLVQQEVSVFRVRLEPRVALAARA